VLELELGLAQPLDQRPLGLELIPQLTDVVPAAR
jgi:hypothetical protein